MPEAGAQPRARGDPSRARAQVEQREGVAVRSRRSGRRPQKASPVPMHLRDAQLPRRGSGSATARATSILTTHPRGGCRSSTCRPRWRASGSTDPAGTVPSPDRRRARARGADSEPEDADERRGQEVTMETSDVLAIVAATVVAILAGVLVVALVRARADAARAARRPSHTPPRGDRSRCSTTRTTRSSSATQRGRPHRPARRRRPSASTTRSTARSAWPTRRSRRRSSRRWRSVPACHAPRTGSATAKATPLRRARRRRSKSRRTKRVS